MLLTLFTLGYSVFSELKNQILTSTSKKLSSQTPCCSCRENMERVKERPAFYETELNKTVWNIPQHYTNFEPVGAGAFGQVYCAHDSKRNRKVAVKKLSRPFQTFEHAKRTYREIKLLSFMDHDNIIDLLDVFTPSMSYEDFQDVYLVSSYIGSDLNTHIKAANLELDQIQLIVYQILRGLKDLKPSNIVVNTDAELKIIDFGLARLGEDEMTGYVTTRYYRAPEIMLNWMHYGETVDIWSVGCIMAEMLTGRTLFPGKCHIDQLKKTLALLGTPGSQLLNKMTSEYGRKYIESQPKVPKRNFAEVFPKADEQCIDLLEKMLLLDPDDRITAEKALAHPFFGLLADPDDEPTSEPFIDPKDSDSKDTEVWRRLVYESITNFKPPEVDALDL